MKWLKVSIAFWLAQFLLIAAAVIGYGPRIPGSNLTQVVPVEAMPATTAPSPTLGVNPAPETPTASARKPTVSSTTPAGAAPTPPPASGPTTAPTVAPARTLVCPVQIAGKLYDLGEFRRIHAGGDVFQCGTDMTAVFNGQHPASYLSKLSPYLVQ